ncbi:bifunctional diguanylate cyclase/phosphodiesterase [Kineosporia sp. R_H_3]|uniref:putative bifunctional diguanylate cyclase/phosphodiesterase n=1 Tax=Kineosporia sp. R_H_3 TaxID=1961848 RepID=UPI000B4BE64D|nr:GGDEF domain-containing phosphodiesterase [Kineosporia sp. R_H_3]
MPSSTPEQDQRETGSPRAVDVDPLMRTVLDAVTVGVVVQDGRGTTVAMNPRADDLLRADAGSVDVNVTSVPVRLPAGDAFLVSTVVDVSDSAALGRARNRFAAAMDSSPIAVALLDRSGRIKEGNRVLGRMLGRTPAELAGTTFAELSHPDDVDADATLLARTLAGERPTYSLEKRFVRRSGESVWGRLTVTAVEDGDGTLVELVAQVVDVTEIRLAEEMLAHQALHDPLTKLPNRTLGLDRIQQALDRTRRSRRRVAVLACDLDRFDVVNDSIGPEHGDEILVEIANRIQTVLRATDTAARMAGDEFVVVCEDVLDEREAVLVADRITAAVREPIDIASRSVVLSMSIGIALSSGPTGDATALLRDAGAALHRAKENGRGGWDVVDDDLRRRAVDRLDIEHALRAGLAHGDLRLHYQPIVDLRTGAMVGREALVRWQHPTRGLLGPAWFLPVAEETGLIEDVGRWVLSRAAAVAAQTPEQGYVAVNVSPSQVMRAGLLADVEATLDLTGLEPQNLVIELTESVMLGAAPAGRKELHRLDDLGVRLVVDDFGTGFSALSYLRDLPVSGIKVDRSFTAGLGHDPQCERIVEALTGLAHGLGVDLVAEGVETEAQRALLAEVGCQHAQGYLFGRPTPHPA